MDTFAILEDKVKLLVGHIKKLQTENGQLRLDQEAIATKADELTMENARLIENNIHSFLSYVRHLYHAILHY